MASDGENPIFADALGTYSNQVLAHNTGVAQAQGHILYDSQNYLASVARQGQPGGAGFAAFIPKPARAEGRKPLMLAVEGIVYWEPSTWAIGNLMAIGMRIGVFEQDPILGVLSLDPEYSMWVPAASGIQPANWANSGRGNAWERRVHYGFSDNQAFTVLRVRWRGRRALQPNEAFAIYTELEPTSVNTRTQFWLRTLVQDEG